MLVPMRGHEFASQSLTAMFSLPGPPLTNDTALVKLLESGVIVGIGVRDAWEARNTRFDIQWVSYRVSHEST